MHQIGLLNKFKSQLICFVRNFTKNYEQGQSFTNVNGKTVREYFYNIDHQGQLFLDDAKIKNFTSCYKEQNFLELFFRNLRLNKSDRFHNEFKYVSNCGIERNYLKCDDLPFVASHLDQENNVFYLNHIKSDYWSVKFEPQNLVYDLESGRLYYFFENLKCNPMNKTASIDSELMIKKKSQFFEKLPCKICLVRSKISIKLMDSLKEVSTKDEQSFEFQYKTKSFKLNLSDHNRFKDELLKCSSFIPNKQ